MKGIPLFFVVRHSSRYYCHLCLYHEGDMHIGCYSESGLEEKLVSVSPSQPLSERSTCGNPVRPAPIVKLESVRRETPVHIRPVDANKRSHGPAIANRDEENDAQRRANDVAAESKHPSSAVVNTSYQGIEHCASALNRDQVGPPSMCTVVAHYDRRIGMPCLCGGGLTLKSFFSSESASAPSCWASSSVLVSSMLCPRCKKLLSFTGLRLCAPNPESMF